MDKIKQKKKKHPPASLQGILWSTNVKNLDLEKDKVYIIHQVLMYGTLKEIAWLFRVYSKNKIEEVFKTEPMKVYTPPIFYFIKNIVLGLKEPLSSKNYVSTLY